MTIGAGLVLFAVIWFMVLFVVLPLRLETQGDKGDITPGTPPGSPSGPVMWRKVRTVTVVSVVLWVVIAGVIASGLISVRDFDVMDRMPPQADGTGE